jgi:twinkle protein
MAQLLRPDSIDFAAYEAATAASHKVRHAAEFLDDVRDEFRDREPGQRHPAMTSTKAGRFIEFRPGEVTAWSGFNGHRKSMFTSQVALDLCSAEQRTLIASLEMNPGKTLARMARQAAGTGRPDDRWLSAFSAWTRDRLWLFDHLGRVSPDLMIGLCRYFAEELSGRQVFIDSMMMVCASEDHLDEQKQFVTDLCRVAQETGLHVHLVTHARKPQSGSEERPPSKYDIRGSAAISDQVANVVTVWQDKRKKSELERNPMAEEWLVKPDALVTVEKQRNGDWEGRMQMWFHGPSLRFCDDRQSPVEPYQLARSLEAA